MVKASLRELCKMRTTFGMINTLLKHYKRQLTRLESALTEISELVLCYEMIENQCQKICC